MEICKVLIAFNKKAIKLQSVLNSITIHCHNTSKGIRIKILVTSSGNIRNQLVYVANHNKTFEGHVQDLVKGRPKIFSEILLMKWSRIGQMKQANIGRGPGPNLGSWKLSSVKVRVLCQEGGVWRGQLVSDWSKMQDGRWKAVFWLDNNSRWWMEQDQQDQAK